jgi:para-aminobenzoate synthetase/4-amino-4-deoxychorismate lyase
MNRPHLLPAEVYTLVERTPATVLLEGGKAETGLHTHPDTHLDTHLDTNETPWTQLFTAPLRVCAAYRAAEIPELFAGIERAVAAGQYAAGFFSYECANFFEPAVQVRAGRSGQPLAWFGIYERGYAFDHAAGRFPDGAPPELDALHSGAESTDAAGIQPEFAAELTLSEAEYARRIAAIHEWIRTGDVYQLNFTAPLQIETTASAAALYARLRARQPVEYGAFLHWRQGSRILSFSPELFFRVEEAGGARRITTRPMKGTAARGRTTREDRERAEWLRNDAKNRSENVMIVDLVRNDLGRLARFGSVRAEKLFAVERYPSLWQMTSTVTAELRPEIGFEEIFRALFPCGSVTGAPKVRAMQLLAGIEDGPRGVYTGAIGYFSPRKTAFNVAIRTLELEQGLGWERGTMGVGSGIVIDSRAGDEYCECLLKAEFLTRTSSGLPDRFSLVETMLWRGGYPFLELHLDRLADSAEYFGFPCERAAVKAAIEEHAGGFAGADAAGTHADRQARKVRLLLDGDGRLRIADELLPENVSENGGPERVCMARVCMAQTRTDPSDPMLFHKTTHRPLYAEAFQTATQAGFDDVLFLNRRGEVTEGAISNLFAVKDGQWRTPPVECGLLAGVYRRHLLETRLDIEERVLHEEDLREADAIYLCNAVRGVRRVRIEW